MTRRYKIQMEDGAYTLPKTWDDVVDYVANDKALRARVDGGSPVTISISEGVFSERNKFLAKRLNDKSIINKLMAKGEAALLEELDEDKQP